MEAGEQVRGTTSPNPPVGAVILDSAGQVVGVGATQPPGGPHAEVMALRDAGDKARGGTAVVTLEPCNHTGRTGPCAQALIDASVAAVYYLHPASPWDSSRNRQKEQMRWSRGCAPLHSVARTSR